MFFPDLTKLTPMLEEAMTSFKSLVEAVARIEVQQAEILKRLDEKEAE